MKRFLLVYVLIGFHVVCHVESWFDVPYKPFQKVTFDVVHRGTMNVTTCGKELLNCWEIIRPEKICFHNNYESICGVMRHECSDLYGPLDDYGHLLNFFEMVCEYYQLHTRRFYVEAFGAEIGAQLMNALHRNMTNSTQPGHPRQET